MSNEIQVHDLVSWSTGLWHGRERSHAGIVIAIVPAGADARYLIPGGIVAGMRSNGFRAQPVVRGYARLLVKAIEPGGTYYYAPTAERVTCLATLLKAGAEGNHAV